MALDKMPQGSQLCPTMGIVTPEQSVKIRMSESTLIRRVSVAVMAWPGLCPGGGLSTHFCGSRYDRCNATARLCRIDRKMAISGRPPASLFHPTLRNRTLAPLLQPGGFHSRDAGGGCGNPGLGGFGPKESCCTAIANGTLANSVTPIMSGASVLIRSIDRVRSICSIYCACRGIPGLDMPAYVLSARVPSGTFLQAAASFLLSFLSRWDQE